MLNFTPDQTMNFHMGSKGIAVPFVNLGARPGWVVNATHRPSYRPGKRRELLLLKIKWF